MDPVVRPASVTDVPALVDLEAAARAGIADVRGGALRLTECPPITDWSPLLVGADTRVLVGTLDDVVLAFMVLVMQPARDRSLVTHVFVDAGARELGLGDAMIEHAIAATNEAGLTGIESTALPGDRDTKNLFERAGMTARKLTVYKSLVAPEPATE